MNIVTLMMRSNITSILISKQSSIDQNGLKSDESHLQLVYSLSYMLMQLHKLHKLLFHRNALFNASAWLRNNRFQILNTRTHKCTEIHIKYQKHYRYHQKELNEEPFHEQCDAKCDRLTCIDWNSTGKK